MTNAQALMTKEIRSPNDEQKPLIILVIQCGHLRNLPSTTVFSVPLWPF